nr:hypothetical protein [Rhodococcus wratislaviensis]
MTFSGPVGVEDSDRFGGGPGVQRQLGGAVQDLEVVIVDDDGDDRSGVCAADAEPLSGDHDHIVPRDPAVDAYPRGGAHGVRVLPA